MDKQNYKLTAEELQLLKKIFFEIKQILVKILEQKKLIKRKRVITDYNILIQACYLYIVERLSYQRLADTMAAKYEVSITDTAWKKWLKKVYNPFLDAAKEILAQQCSEICHTDISFVAVDATDISKEGGDGTEVRVHCALPLDTSALDQAHLSDCHCAETIKNIELKEKNCYIADRAYGKAKQILHVFSSNAYFLFRISSQQITLYSDEQCKQKVDFHNLMTADCFEILCYVKYEKNVQKLRLIGSHLPKERREEAIKRARQTASRKQTKISDCTLINAQWLLLVTNLPEKYTFDLLVSKYYQRWQIELMFKRAKSLLNFHKIRKSSDAYSVMVSSIWIAITLVLCAVQILFQCNNNRSISAFNLFSVSECLFSID